MNSSSYDDTDGAAIDTQPPLVLKLPGGAGAGIRAHGGVSESARCAGRETYNLSGSPA